MDPDLLEVFLRFHFLHWVRCVAMLAPIPVFGEGAGARLGKFALGIMLGSIIAVNFGLGEFDDPGLTLMLPLCILNEVLLGSLFGFVANVTFAAIKIAGNLISTEMGFNLASIQDPITGVNVQVVSHAIEAMGFLLFFAVGGHHTLLRALFHSFSRYRVGQLGIDERLVEATVLYTSGVFAAGFQLAAPVFVAMIVSGVALAFLAKLAPQLQVMQFAFSFKIVGGLLMLIATLPVIIPAMRFVFDRGELAFFDITNP